MYRPLVLPKLQTSRGQPISPGVSLLTTGGPKHRGRLIVNNPHFLNDAEGWNRAVSPCNAYSAGDGFIRIDDLSSATCLFIQQTVDANYPLAQGNRYLIRMVVDLFSATSGNIRLRLGENYLEPPVTSAGVYEGVVRLTEVPLDQEIQLNATNPSDLTAQVSLLSVRFIGN